MGKSRPLWHPDFMVKPEHKETEQKLSKDIETFENLPPKTQESLRLGDEAEKATGKKRADVNSQIKQQSGQSES